MRSRESPSCQTHLYTGTVVCLERQGNSVSPPSTSPSPAMVPFWLFLCCILYNKMVTVSVELPRALGVEANSQAPAL
jgi:hypothetical protein